MEAYHLSILGLAVLCLIPLVLSGIVGPLKGKLGMVGGPVPQGTEDLAVFRLDRAHGNSVETIPVFVLAAILGIMVGLGSCYLAILVWAFVAVRLLYVLVYVRGGPMARGGNLRTGFFVLGSALTIVLIGSVVVRVL